MSVSIILPPPLEESLRREIGDLDRHATEALLVDLYRTERITKPQLAAALGLDRFEVNGVLNRWNVTEDLLTTLELNRQVEVQKAKLDDLSDIADLLDHEAIAACKAHSQNALSIEQVRSLLSVYQGSISELIIQERNER